VIVALSLFVSLAVTLVMVLVPRAAAGTGPSALVTFNACLNAAAAVSLVIGYVCIRRGAIGLHRACMLFAFGLSSLFLVGYLWHHAEVGSIPFRGEGWVRTVYFAVLIPHILLAAAIVPLALFTIYRGWTGRFALHKKIARFTLPLWLYVSVSGVTVYWMLYRL
jgi:putative membrane protein